MTSADLLRNTPTHVGKTALRRERMKERWKHPHACGEDKPSNHCVTGKRETPPRMWGRLAPKKAFAQTRGNTPTHVGKTTLLRHISREVRKHPHACGEDINFCFGQRAGEETPPRMWGRLPQGRHCAPEVRNTPTHVGKTWLSACQTQPIRKHPHACGEDQSRAQSQAVVMETPPRMWGRPGTGTRRRARKRNTPTHVGKTPAYCV